MSSASGSEHTYSPHSNEKGANDNDAPAPQRLKGTGRLAGLIMIAAIVAAARSFASVPADSLRHHVDEPLHGFTLLVFPCHEWPARDISEVRVASRETPTIAAAE